MKTITALTHTDDGHPPQPIPPRIIKGKLVAPPFRRQVRHVAAGIYAESTSGGKVFIPWSALETCDPLLCAPKSIDTTPKTS